MKASFEKLTSLLASEDFDSFMQGCQLLVSLKNPDIENKILAKLRLDKNTGFEMGRYHLKVSYLYLGNESITDEDRICVILALLALKAKNPLAQSIAASIESIQLKNGAKDFVEQGFPAFKSLISIDISNYDDITEEDFNHILKIKGLKRLYASWTTIPESIFQKMPAAWPELEFLDARVLNAKCLEHLNNMKHLVYLKIENENEMDFPIPKIDLPKLRYFSVGGYLSLDNLPKSKTIETFNCNFIDNSYFLPKELDEDGDEISRDPAKFDLSLKLFPDHLPNLRHLEISSFDQTASLSGSKELDKLKALQSLNLANFHFSSKEDFLSILTLPISKLKCINYSLGKDEGDEEIRFETLTLTNPNWNELDFHARVETELVVKDCKKLTAFTLNAESDELIRLIIDSCPISSLDLDISSDFIEFSNINIERFYWNSRAVRNLKIKKLNKLEQLDLNGNVHLRELILEETPNLKSLRLSGCLDLSEKSVQGLLPLKDYIQDWDVNFTSFSDDFCKDLIPAIRFGSSSPQTFSFKWVLNVLHSEMGVIPFTPDEDELESLSPEAKKTIKDHKGIPAKRYKYNSNNTLTVVFTLELPKQFSSLQKFFEVLEKEIVFFENVSPSKLPFEVLQSIDLLENEADDLDSEIFEVDPIFEDLYYDSDNFKPTKTKNESGLKAYKNNDLNLMHSEFPDFISMYELNGEMGTKLIMFLDKIKEEAK